MYSDQEHLADNCGARRQLLVVEQDPLAGKLDAATLRRYRLGDRPLPGGKPGSKVSPVHLLQHRIFQSLVSDDAL